MSDVIHLDRRGKYDDLHSTVLDCARLCDLALAVHREETDNGRELSTFGSVNDLVLKQLQARLHDLVTEIWG